MSLEKYIWYVQNPPRILTYGKEYKNIDICMVRHRNKHGQKIIKNIRGTYVDYNCFRQIIQNDYISTFKYYSIISYYKPSRYFVCCQCSEPFVRNKLENLVDECPKKIVCDICLLQKKKWNHLIKSYFKKNIYLYPRPTLTIILEKKIPKDLSNIILDYLNFSKKIRENIFITDYLNKEETKKESNMKRCNYILTNSSCSEDKNKKKKINLYYPLLSFLTRISLFLSRNKNKVYLCILFFIFRKSVL